MEFRKFDEALKRTINEFDGKDKFGYIGLFGSLNVKNDIDMCIYPSEKAEIGEFINHLQKFISKLEKNLPKNSRLIIIPHFFLQEEIMHISERREEDVPLHISTFPDIIDNGKNWVTENIVKISKKYYGNPEEIKEIRESEFNFFYKYLWIKNCVYSKYPESLRKEKINKLIYYILKNIGKGEEEKYDILCKFVDFLKKTT